MNEFSIENLSKLPRFVASITPQRYDPKALDVQRCRAIVEAGQVRARGWYFPHIDRERLAAGPKLEYIQNEADYQGFVDHIERWRFYTSGQFVFQMMAWEVPDKEAQEEMRKQTTMFYPDRAKSIVAGFLSFIMCIYSISEVYVFASRLAQEIPYDTSVEIMVGYRSVKNWALGSLEPSVSLDFPYITPNDTLTSERTVALDDLIAKPLELAAAAVIEIFEQFSWSNASPSMIASWQGQIFAPRRRGY